MCVILTMNSSAPLSPPEQGPQDRSLLFDSPPSPCRQRAARKSTLLAEPRKLIRTRITPIESGQGSRSSEHIIARAMSLLLPPSPPEQIPRLYIGGLTPGITDEALRALLARFGAPQALQRSSLRTFAHVSLALRDGFNPERCVAALHNTTWRGAVLRVQRAREHFAARLRREWAETDEPAAEEVLDEELRQRKPFSAVRCGVHKRFSFKDEVDGSHAFQLAFGDAVLNNDEGMLATGSEDVPAYVHDFPAEHHEELKGKGRRTKPARARSETVSSTLQLFGLAQAVELGDAARDADVSEPVTGSCEVPSRPSKRQRRCQGSDLEYAKAVELDPAAFDATQEKDVALSVLRNMFPARSREAIIVSCRRLGLYRKLELGQPAGKPAGSESRRQQASRVQRRHRAWVQRQSADKRPLNISQPAHPPSKDRTKAGHRRLGLYKKLNHNP